MGGDLITGNNRSAQRYVERECPLSTHCGQSERKLRQRIVRAFSLDSMSEPASKVAGDQKPT
jgi:hypothetical protein